MRKDERNHCVGGFICDKKNHVNLHKLYSFDFLGLHNVDSVKLLRQ